ncbi:hypothetical protein TrVGV298_000068 [Trichoderma virens]|nr:hypothetical protein TrVGV298_000068 [Trichoderma virens]
MTMETEYTVDEVAQHMEPNDVWMVIHDEVYDVTKYLLDHPGGIEVLIEAAGTDASDSFDNAGHSDDAFDLMVPFRIGRVQNSANKKSKIPTAMKPPTEKFNSSRDYPNPNRITLTCLSLGIAATSYGVLKYKCGISAFTPSKMPQMNTLMHVLSTLAMPITSSPSTATGYLKGLLGSSCILMGCTALAIKKSFSIIMNDTSFRKLPPHLKLPKPVERDPLLQRGWLDSVSSPVPLTKKILIAPNVYRLVFSLPHQQVMLGLPTGQHITITATVGGEKVTRSYTPVSNNLDYGILELVVKMYPGGKLTGGYLANLQVGDKIHLQGPKGAMRYSYGLCKKIGMLAGGTGITPMFQLIRAICENNRDTTEISLVYASQTEDDILLKEELDNFSQLYPNLFKVFYVVERPSPTWESGVGYITKDVAAQRLPLPGTDVKIMVCGPAGMVSSAKKFLKELGYETPGASPKMSDQVFIF